MSPKTDYPEDEEESRFIASCHKAEEAALKLIARAEQTGFGLTAKLERKGYNSAVIKEIISGLLDRGLLDDERYAVLWLRSRLVKQVQSPRWLLLSLRKRGINRNSSQQALDKVLDPDSEYELLLKYIERLENSPISKSNGNFSLRAQLRQEGFSMVSLDRYFEN